MRDVHVVPVSGVVTTEETWAHEGLGIALPAPPVRMSNSSTQAEREAAVAVLSAGLASTVPAPGRGPLVVPRVSSWTIPGGVLRGTFAAAWWMLRTHMLLLLAVILTCAVAFRLDWPLAGWGAACVGLSAISVIVHEMGHVLAFRLLSHRAMVLRVEGISARVMWPSTGGPADAFVVVGGPLAPLAVSIVCAPLLIAEPVAGAIAAILSASHALTLCLSTGDGGELRSVLRSRATPLDTVQTNRETASRSRSR